MMIGSSILPLPQGLTLGLFLVLTVAYLVGAAFNILMRTGYAVRSKVNLYPTRLAFLQHNWDTITVRVFVYGYGLFYAWSLHPEWLQKIALFFGSPDWLANWMIFPINVATSAGFGFFIDVALDSLQSIAANTTNPYLKWLNVLLRGRIPTYDSTVVDTSALDKK